MRNAYHYHSIDEIEVEQHELPSSQDHADHNLRDQATDGSVQVDPGPAEVLIDNITSLDVLDEHGDGGFLMPPAWRWDRAKAAVAGAGQSGVADPAVLDLITCLRHRADQATGTSSGTLPHRLKPLMQAIQIYEEDGDVAAEIEARVLAGQDDEQIGRQMGMSAEIVAVYHESFYSVRRLLDKPGWLWNHAVYSRIDRKAGLRRGDYWRVAAFRMGDPFLERYLAHDKSGGLLSDPDFAVQATLFQDMITVELLRKDTAQARDALCRMIRHFEAKDTPEASLVVVQCRLILVMGGWTQDGAMRLDDPSRQAQVKEMKPEEIARLQRMMDECSRNPGFNFDGFTSHDI